MIAFIFKSRFSGDAILVLYEPNRKFMPKGAPAAPASGVDVAAMQNAAQRAVSEGLKALFDDYTVTPEELGDFKGANVSFDLCLGDNYF